MMCDRCLDLHFFKTISVIIIRIIEQLGIVVFGADVNFE